MFGLDIFNTVAKGVSNYVKGKQELAKIDLEAKKAIRQAKADSEIAKEQAKMDMLLKLQAQLP